MPDDVQVPADMPPAPYKDGQEIGIEFWLDTGLLWKINHDILHPIGLAIGIGVDDARLPRFTVQVSDDGVWFFDYEVNADKAAIFEAWTASVRKWSRQ